MLVPERSQRLFRLLLPVELKTEYLVTVAPAVDMLHAGVEEGVSSLGSDNFLGLYQELKFEPCIF